MEDNRLIQGIAFLERTRPVMKVDSRAQLKKSDLRFVKQNIGSALGQLNEVKDCNIFITGRLVGIIDCIDNLLNEPGFVETDLGAKQFLITNLEESLDVLYFEAGKYYTTHEFTFYERMQPLLNNIVENCIEKGYYFGLVV